MTESERSSLAFNFYYNDGTSMAENFRNKYAEKIPSAYQFNQDSKALDGLCQKSFSGTMTFTGSIFLPPAVIFSIRAPARTEPVLLPMVLKRTNGTRSTLELNGKYYISPSDTTTCLPEIQRSVFFSQYLKDVYTHK